MKKGVTSKGKKFAFLADPPVERIILRIAREEGLSKSKIINRGIFNAYPKHRGKKDELPC